MIFLRSKSGFVVTVVFERKENTNSRRRNETNRSDDEYTWKSAQMHQTHR